MEEETNEYLQITNHLDEVQNPTLDTEFSEFTKRSLSESIVFKDHIFDKCKNLNPLVKKSIEAKTVAFKDIVSRSNR